jgi:glycerol kinase
MVTAAIDRASTRMSAPQYILAIDQGTTSTRAILFDRQGRPVGMSQKELTQIYPADGWVEHDLEDIWRDTVAVCRGTLVEAGVAWDQVAAIGITNQRETTALWDRATGEPVHRAIVWQDRRTADACRRIAAEGAADMVHQRTGLVLDAYFSATKLAWLLDTLPGVRQRAEHGELCFGTVDSFLLYRFTGGEVHATDATNASRTLLFNLRTQDWDPELLRLFRIPAAMLPEIKDSAAWFGATEAHLFGRPIPIGGVAGDQQAAAFGQVCFAPGTVKATYGTGCFMLRHIGDRPILSRQRLLTTVGIRLKGKPSFAHEGSIFVAGAAVKWLRDGLGLLTHAHETNDMATRVPDNHGVYMVPAFVGLGAPHWDPDARGAVFGLSLDTTRAHLARAALEAVAYQTLDLEQAMAADGPRGDGVLKVDGGMVANDWLCQFLADMLNQPIERPVVTETTALGAAFLAGLTVELWSGLDELQSVWTCERRFEPKMGAVDRQILYDGWRRAVRRTLSAENLDAVRTDP